MFNALYSDTTYYAKCTHSYAVIVVLPGQWNLITCFGFLKFDLVRAVVRLLATLFLKKSISNAKFLMNPWNDAKVKFDE